MKGNLFDTQGKAIWNGITCIFTTLQKPNYNFEWLKKIFISLKIIQNGIKKNQQWSSLNPLTAVTVDQV